MKIVPLVLVVAVLALWSGCARTDRIQQTLVTVDVTGTCQGMGGNLELKLVQQGQGPKVTGFVVWRGLTGADAGTSGTTSGPVEGSVAGDMFRWSQTRGAVRVGDSEMTVNGDEMNGRVRVGQTSFLVLLRRLDASRPSW